MNANSIPPNRSVAPLWIIAGALATIALCLVAVVLRMWIRQGPALASESASATSVHVRPPEREADRAVRRSGMIRSRLEPPVSAVNLENVSVEANPDLPETVVEENLLAGVAPILQLDPAPAPVGAAYPNGNIVGQVRFTGTPPVERPIEMGVGLFCTNVQGRPLTTQFFIVGTNGELADVLVYVKSGAASGVSSVAAVRPATNELRFIGCQIEPYVSAMTQGQKLLLLNTNAGLHSATVELGANRLANFALWKDKPSPAVTMRETGLFRRISCEVHPWEFAYVSVMATPFFAVTDREGRFAITNIPPGDYVIEAIHRKPTAQMASNRTSS